jgi:ribosomal-protein-alanine N-acetyltransferase
METMELKTLTKELCHPAAEIEKLYLSTNWSENQLCDIVENKNYKYIVCLINGEAVGVGGAICTSPYSCEIFTVAVKEENRGLGIGKAIVDALIQFCKEKQGESIFLEVEENNQSAIKLYEKCGFVSVGVRRGFYKGKNAIIMEKPLKNIN